MLPDETNGGSWMPGSNVRRVPLDSTAPYLASLAREAAAGGLGAASKLMAYLEPTTHRVLVGLLGARCPELPEAAAQVFVLIIQGFDSVRDHCHPAGLGARAAFRVAGSLRSRIRARTEGASYPARYRSLRSRARERTEAFCRVLDSLPEESAEILLFRVLLGWSLSDIASATGDAPATVRLRLRTAKEAWREHLAKLVELSDWPDLGDLEDPGGSPQIHPEAFLDAVHQGERLAEANQIVEAHRSACPICRLESQLRSDFEWQAVAGSRPWGGRRPPLAHSPLARSPLARQSVALAAAVLSAISGGVAWLSLR